MDSADPVDEDVDARVLSIGDRRPGGGRVGTPLGGDNSMSTGHLAPTAVFDVVQDRALAFGAGRPAGFQSGG